MFYASRHTFRMAAAGWVTIDLANTGSGSDRIDAYVLLLNGNAPDGAGTRLAHDDDSGAPDGRYNLDSRIARRFLQPGVYTIEATTFGPRDQGSYRVTVTADYKPKITGTAAQAVMRVENGDTVTRKWAYTPASTRVALAAVISTDGIDTKVTADQGDATLTATPSEVGTYDVYVAHSNGGTTSSLHTQIISYCPEGHIELPSDCGLPQRVLAARSSYQLAFRPDDNRVPKGYEDSNFCAGVKTAAKRWRYVCRQMPKVQRSYMSKSDPRILGISEPFSSSGTDYGRTMLWLSSDGEVLGREGCQAVTAKVWQCDWHTSGIWTIELEEASLGDLARPAIRRLLATQAEITAQVTAALVKCAGAVLQVLASLRQGGLDPQAGAAVATDCPEVGPSAS